MFTKAIEQTTQSSVINEKGTLTVELASWCRNESMAWPPCPRMDDWRIPIETESSDLFLRSPRLPSWSLPPRAQPSPARHSSSSSPSRSRPGHSPAHPRSLGEIYRKIKENDGRTNTAFDVIFAIQRPCDQATVMTSRPSWFPWGQRISLWVCTAADAAATVSARDLIRLRRGWARISSLL